MSGLLFSNYEFNSFFCCIWSKMFNYEYLPFLVKNWGILLGFNTTLETNTCNYLVNYLGFYFYFNNFLILSYSWRNYLFFLLLLRKIKIIVTYLSLSSNYFCKCMYYFNCFPMIYTFVYIGIFFFRVVLLIPLLTSRITYHD